MGLTVTDAFNIVRLPHRGPHPYEYHEWVEENIELINANIAIRVANDELSPAEAQAEFLLMFETNITNRILLDPTIFRKAYWDCYRT